MKINNLEDAYNIFLKEQPNSEVIKCYKGEFGDSFIYVFQIVKKGTPKEFQEFQPTKMMCIDANDGSVFYVEGVSSGIFPEHLQEVKL